MNEKLNEEATKPNHFILSLNQLINLYLKQTHLFIKETIDLIKD